MLFWAVLFTNTLFFIRSQGVGEIKSKTFMVILTFYLLAHGLVYGLIRLFNHKNIRRM
jgi:hypothetical protein